MPHPLRFFSITLVVAALSLNAQEPSKDTQEKPSGEKKQEQKEKSDGGKEDKSKDEKPKEEKPKEKSGAIALGGAQVKYLVQTGTMPVFKEDGAIRANVFYVYYAALDPAGKRRAQSEPGARPIAFCFNGGPGSSAVWLHLGALGPRKIDLPPDGLTPSTVAKIVDNPNSILDVTDLVFIDPVSTGLSLAAKGEKPEQFFGVDEDIEAVGEFVRLFTTREQRWASPKYMCGESYGVLRAAGLSEYLQERHGMYFEGLIMLSGLINWQTLSADPGNDLPFILALPTLTATAHYHKKLPQDLQADLAKAIAESRAFARGEYATALLKGSALAPDERQRITERLARFTGLTPKQADEQELRFSPSFFREMLLRDDGKIIGRYDARVIGDDGNRARNTPEFDPSFAFILGPFSAAVNAYVRGELGYESDHPYRVLAPLQWRYTSFPNKYVALDSRLAGAMKENPKLRMLILTSDRDLAVPRDVMHYSVDHLPIPQGLRPNIRFAEFESGHMMYLNAPDAEKLRRELVQFIAQPAGR